eukprot:TRINITY_DN7613_c0_g1_i3.p1 TRINITY_DN7613_c0_g1~~TRINITY_DN7613_c0_g1_i3.p1  ORF type:complete len:671 (-),score=211.19 TRINITY_DN7613_c0_g1_i3:64-2076(-)
MNADERKDLMTKSNLSIKLAKVLDNREDFEAKIKAELKAVGDKVEDATMENASVDANSDMLVCVRIRPRLQEEIDEDFFVNVQDLSRTEVAHFEPSFSVKGHARVAMSNFTVDRAFGPQDENSRVYSELGPDLVDLALQGGICSMLSYGQTGAGKTFTMNGMLHHLANDLFDRQAKCKGKINLYLSCFELLGDKLSDLQAAQLIETSSEEKQANKLEILEDKFGKVQVKGAEEKQLTSAQHLQQLVMTAANHRRTTATFKNDTSSRSHAVYKIRIENEAYKSAEDGILFVIDLAGSENSADSQFHDKERIKETRQINTSLMALKECIINRAKASVDTEKHYHIPFRQSKLTLLLKDAFELESHKICRTIVFANVSPTIADTSMTLNTLRYVAPIKEGMKGRVKEEVDPNNPMNWDNERLREWFHQNAKEIVDMEKICPFESGRQILRIPEVEFLDRLMASSKDGKLGPKKAKAIYGKLWCALIDARTKDRKEKAKTRNKLDEDIVYGEEVKNAEIDEYKDVIENNLHFKGVSPVVIFDNNLNLCGKSSNVSENVYQLKHWAKAFQDSLKAPEELCLSGVKYSKVESSDNVWKGQAVSEYKDENLPISEQSEVSSAPGLDGKNVGILRIEKLPHLWFIAGAKSLTHRSLEAYIQAPIESLRPGTTTFSEPA